MTKIGAVLLCAGKGLRAGEDKLLRVIGGKSVMERSLELLLGCKLIDKLVLVASQDNLAFAQALGESAKVAVVLGGRERRHSVYCGLVALGNVDIAVIHDGARCFTTAEIVQNCVLSAVYNGSGVAAIPATDTLKRVVDTVAVENIEREGVWRTQTPQCFAYGDILRGYERAIAEDITLTDDASAYALAGKNALLVPASPSNIKITTQEDMALAQRLLAPKTRTGLGEDSHRLVNGRKLVLGGVTLPFSKGLEGHSDGDALTHAVADALLGACALGDIGRSFPDSDGRYKDIYSIELLKSAAQAARDGGFAIVNADAVVVAQQPKLSPFVKQMEGLLAAAMGIEEGCVSVKATTSEGMGFEGTGEGITARAVVTVEG